MAKKYRSADLKWHMAHDYLLPVVMSHIKVAKKELNTKGLSEEERSWIQFKLAAWEELKKEMS